MPNRDETVRAIALEIERYLSARQAAADSPEGIRDFWLPAYLRAEPLEWVVLALEELRNRGVVTKTEIEGASPVYSMAAWGAVH
jgi:hypothetical protein